MGYTTDFNGSFSLSKPATAEQIEYINTFSSTRRMGRDVSALMEKYKGAHGLNGNYGIEGEYFAFNDGNYGQSESTGIIDFNQPPSTQPGLWCQWVLDEDGEELEWNDGEKFYCYVDWLKYMIENFFKPWGITLNGTVKWRGEDFDDMGKIIVIDNVVTTEDFH